MDRLPVVGDGAELLEGVAAEVAAVVTVHAADVDELAEAGLFGRGEGVGLAIEEVVEAGGTQQCAFVGANSSASVKVSIFFVGAEIEYDFDFIPRGSFGPCTTSGSGSSRPSSSADTSWPPVHSQDLGKGCQSKE